MDYIPTGVFLAAVALPGGYFILRRKYFLPQYRWRLVVFLDVVLIVGYLAICWPSFPALAIATFLGVMGAASAILLVVEYRLLQGYRLSRRRVDDTFG